MAGFSLGGSSRGGGAGGGEEGGIPPETFFHLYGGGGGAAPNTGGNTGSSRNEEITSYTRGFELWQQHQQQIQRHQHQQQLYPSDGLLTFSDEALHLTGGSGSRGGGGAEALGIRMRGPGGGSAAGMSCQDCGNQAKKDCAHMRCRTCCKSRAFQCPTHVKSTWIPASKRRERQQQLDAAAALQQQQPQQQQHQSLPQPLRIGGPSGGGEPSKRQREIATRVPTTISTTTSGGGGGMDALSFPAEVSSPAVFRCVRVSPLDYADDEYAYQTAVSIAGHVFKGILYDQGPESQYPTTPRALTAGESSSSSAAAAALTTAATIATTLGTAHPGGGTGTTSAAPSTAGLLDPSSLYPTPLSAFMAGTQFFAHHPRPQ